jgi:hypothetical protein
MADLEGKTIGELLGGAPYNALSQMLRYVLGSGDPRAPGINVVSIPMASHAAAVPQCADATIAIRRNTHARWVGPDSGG